MVATLGFRGLGFIGLGISGLWGFNFGFTGFRA